MRGGVWLWLMTTSLPLMWADLPVHCIEDQMYGEWMFHLGPAGYTNSLLCGHAQPDNPHENWESKPRSYKVLHEEKVYLFENNTATDASGNHGTWTMIYDEGWEVTIAERSFFAFSKFVPRPAMANPYSLAVEDGDADADDYQSVCSETVDGWYHAVDGSNWGCYFATKSNRDTDPEALVSGSEITGISEQSFLQVAPERKGSGVNAIPDNRADHVKYSGLPDAWDWRDVDGQDWLPLPRRQGSCGSCYAIAATQMVEARIRIATNNTVKVQLSPQSILSCSAYSQGCDGGFPYLVGKYGSDFGFMEEECLPYRPKQTHCEAHCEHPVLWRTTNYHYIGGAYGKCSEVEMMREIKAKGPIIAGFNAPQDLFFYNEGIYHLDEDVAYIELESSTQQQLRDLTFEQVPVATRSNKKHAFFEKTNHAVLIVGWGVDHDEKYWIVQNTWGDDWGEAGYFKIVRGVDMCAFEAMAVAFDPIIPENVSVTPPLAGLDPALAKRLQPELLNVDGPAEAKLDQILETTAQLQVDEGVDSPKLQPLPLLHLDTASPQPPDEEAVPADSHIHHKHRHRHRHHNP